VNKWKLGLLFLIIVGIVSTVSFILLFRPRNDGTPGYVIVGEEIG